MSDDRILSTARYFAGDGDAAQAFPAGGRTHALPVPHGALVNVGATLQPATSLLWFGIPAGKVVRFGQAAQLAGKTVEQARAQMFPLVGPLNVPMVIADEFNDQVVMLADGDADVTVYIAEGATLGGLSA